MNRTGLSDPILEYLCREELPVTRVEYLKRAYPSVPLQEWTAELDSSLPEYLLPGWDWEEQGFPPMPKPQGSPEH